MKALARLGKILSVACIYFTVVTLLLYTCGSLAAEPGHQWIPTLQMMYMLLVFCILFESANQLVLRTKLPYALKLLLHYGACTMIFSVIFIVWGQTAVNAGSTLVILTAFTLVYAACAVILTFIRSLGRAKQNRESAYESQFKNVKK